MNEIVLNHPLITHKLAILRDVNTGTKRVQRTCHRNFHSFML